MALLRRPSKLEWTLIAMNVAFFALFGTEFVHALSSVPCLPSNPDPGCYPWGAEGPVAGLWNYESKAHYLADLGMKGGLLLFVVGLPIISTRRPLNIAALVAAMPAIAAFSWATGVPS